MKKVLSIVVPLILIIGLCYYYFGGSEEYSFLGACQNVSNLNWSNPLDTFTSIFNDFSALKNLNWSGDFLGSLGSIPIILAKMFVAPINVIFSILNDLKNILSALLIMLGFNGLF